MKCQGYTQCPLYYRMDRFCYEGCAVGGRNLSSPPNQSIRASSECRLQSYSIEYVEVAQSLLLLKLGTLGLFQGTKLNRHVRSTLRVWMDPLCERSIITATITSYERNTLLCYGNQSHNTSIHTVQLNSTQVNYQTGKTCRIDTLDHHVPSGKLSGGFR